MCTCNCTVGKKTSMPFSMAIGNNMAVGNVELMYRSVLKH